MEVDLSVDNDNWGKQWYSGNFKIRKKKKTERGLN